MTAGICSVLPENIVVRHIQDLFEKNDLVRVQMPLTGFDLGQGTPGDVTAAQLKAGGQDLLRDARPLAQEADVLPDPLFHRRVHAVTSFISIFFCEKLLTKLYPCIIIQLHLYRSKTCTKQEENNQ